MPSLYASLDKARPCILGILRIIVALLFMQHGLQKIFRLPFGWPADETAPLRPRGNRCVKK
jgi:uncharacterized membrane protein YphA (DoxX/SURF4 family)